MGLYFASLNSGSNGNCYYLANEDDAILIDAGICCKETEIRMARLGLSMSRVRAIFISHEHSDHIRGLAVLAKKYQIPVFITRATMLKGRISLPEHLIRPFSAHSAIEIGELTVLPFPKLHDAGDPHSFIVTCRNTTVGVFTDIGYVCEQVSRYFKRCHAAFLETNYDEVMLKNGFYPYHLKRRITGGKGHLSNRQALGLFNTHKPEYMTHLLLSHLSKDNNSPDLVMDLFRKSAGSVEIVHASRDKETALYFVSAANVECKKEPARITVKPEVIQYSLFG